MKPGQIKTLRAAILLFTAMVLGLLLSLSCATANQSTNIPSPTLAPDEFLGQGQGANLQQALNAAKASALKAAVVLRLGKDAEFRRQAELQAAVYNPARIDGLIQPGSLKRLKSVNIGSIEQPKWQLDISLTINRQAFETALAALDNPGQVATVKPIAVIVPSGPNEAQKAFIQKYVDKLNYLVSFNPTDDPDSALALQSAVNVANSWLANQGLDVASPAQIDKLKKDRSMLFEEQTGGQNSLIQWISQSLDADIYLQIDARLTKESRSRSWYAQATVSIQMYESSTGQLLASTPTVSGPQRMSSIDQTDADSKSMQDAVYGLMPQVLEQSRSLLARQYANGIKYQLVIQNARDPDLIADFRSALKRQANIADVLTRSESEDEVVMDVYMFGRVDDLGDTIRAVRSGIIGLDKMRQVQKRGKSLSYDSGL